MSAANLSEAQRLELAASAVRVLPTTSGRPPLLLICEHAGKEVPPAWRNLDLPPAFLDTHFGWDIGAGALTELLAERLAAPAVLANYSRLFLDINRSPGDWDCLRPDLGGIPVPGNRTATAEDRALREAIARVPFDSAVGHFLRERPAVVSVHSFTPVMTGKERPTEIGVLWRKECRMGSHVLKRLRSENRFVVDGNEPYDWHSSEGYTLRRHGLDRGLACLYLEIRNDLLVTPESLARVADALAPALAEEVLLMDSRAAAAIEID